MSYRDTIDHTGIVDAVTDQVATIRINSQSACGSCHAKGACSAADQSEKFLTVATEGKEVQPGEQVMVHIARRTGLRAVAYGYVYPFISVMVILIALTSAGVPELQAGLWSLASLAPYYLVIYLLKDRISNSFTFKLEKLFNDV
ncbi:MAG: SoxR reducing system RseC family protein [Bacteroidales bacterium]